MAGAPSDDEFNVRLNTYLEAHGLVHLMTRPFEFNAGETAAPCYHMVYGESGRGHHSVVALNGLIIHDPHPSRAGLEEDKRDDWVYGFLVAACRRASPPLPDLP
jgi:hypothetical protein